MKRAVALLSLLLASACSGGPAAPRTAAATATSVPSSASPSPSRTAAVAPSPSNPVPRGTRVPSAFAASDATFVSDQTGWALGQATCASGSGPCAALLRTQDGGRTWRAIPPPPGTFQSFHHVRFADEHNGFVWGDRLWVTHDGGSTWRRVARPSRVSSLEVARGVAWMVGDRAQVFRGPTTASAYEPVEGFFDALDMGLVVHGATAFTGSYAGHGRSLLEVATASGGRATRSTPCESDFLPVLAARTESDLLLVCGVDDSAMGFSPKTAWRSRDAGRRWTRLADPAQRGGTFVSAPRRALVVAANDLVQTSSDGGRSWRDVLHQDTVFTAVGFESDRLGFAIGDVHVGEGMWITRDDGRTWETVDFRRTGSS